MTDALPPTMPAPVRPGPLARARRATQRALQAPAVEIALAVAILASVVTLIVELTLSPAHASWAPVLGHVNEGLTAAFVVELLLRFWVAPRKGRFFQRYALDIVAVLPWARPLRLLRVLRLFRAGVLLNRRLTEPTGMLRGSWNELTAVAAVSVTLVLLGGLTLSTEPSSVDLGPLGVDGVWGHLWYALYTLVGGEPIGGSPVTPLGRVTTLALMIVGMTVFGVFVGAVSASTAEMLRRRMGAPDMALDELSDHVVVCGWNPGGPTMLQELFAEGHHDHVVIVTESPERPKDLHVAGIRGELVHYLHGDYTRVEVLEEVGIHTASAAILLTDASVPRSDEDRDARTVLAALTIERIAPGIYCCAELINGQHASLLRMAKVEEVVIRDWYAGRIMGTLGRNRGVATVLHDILSYEEGNGLHTIEVSKRRAGTDLGTLFHELKARHDALLVSWEHAGEVVVNPPLDAVVQAGDRLIVVAPKRPRLG